MIDQSVLYDELIYSNILIYTVNGTTTRHNIAHDISGVLIGALLPAPFFILAIFGIMELDDAFIFAKWVLVGVLLFYGYAVSRLNGHSQLFSIILAIAASTIGLLRGLKSNGTKTYANKSVTNQLNS